MNPETIVGLSVAALFLLLFIGMALAGVVAALCGMLVAIRNISLEIRMQTAAIQYDSDRYWVREEAEAAEEALAIAATAARGGECLKCACDPCVCWHDDEELDERETGES
jgi:hypothetical protein